MVDFVGMGRQEAERFLAAFLARTPERLTALTDEVARTGGPADVLDRTAASLEPLWGWAEPRWAWRTGYHPPLGGSPGPRVPREALEPLDTFPEWFDPDLLNWAYFTRGSIWLIDGLARYLGECMLAAVPGARWDVGHERRKGYVYQNHPVIVGLPLGDPVEPMWSVSIVAGRALSPSTGPSTLMDLFTAWTTPPREMQD